jgi:hypothetical protein
LTKTINRRFCTNGVSRYDLPTSASSVDWNGNLLAYGHDNGVSVLTPIPQDSKIAKSFPSPFQREWIFQVTNIETSSPVRIVKFTSKYLIAVHDDYSMTLINNLEESETKLNKNGHTGDINDIDISDNGLIVSVGDDKQVIIWDNDKIQAKIPTYGIPTVVKFWADKDFDKIIVVENGNVVKVLDWRNKAWLYTIYPKSYSVNSKSFIKDVIIHQNKIIVVGDGWLKKYSVDDLNGGTGYTYANEEVQLNGWVVDSKYITSPTSTSTSANKTPLIGGISSDRSSFYDFASNSNQVHQLKLQLPSLSVPAGRINSAGIVVFVSGMRLVLARPFDSYEVVQYR